jgi:hypothetical protein
METPKQRTQIMYVLRSIIGCTLTGLVAFCATIGLNQRVAAEQPPAPAEKGIEVLTRGPVHEAFAETIAFDPQQGVVVPKTPPGAIDEATPPQRPQGKNIAWIPGYWAWDDERNDYLWLSGIWRALPPGRQWVPGYWGQSQKGFQWTSGYWAGAAATEVGYLPKPPATVETGPNIAAPSADDIWLPGCWLWQQNRYAWRAGYWTRGNQDWDWVPDHYVWTPSGYVFVNGYYDYSVSRRGVVFAPVYFNAGYRSRRDFSYSPSTVINAGVFASYLFLRPGYGHYYFGDYYGTNYADAGFFPWFSFQSSRRGYDPIFANQRWQHRQDRDWEHRTASSFQNFRDHADTRPPQTLAAQKALDASVAGSDKNRIAVATSLNELAESKIGEQRFQPVNSAEQQQFSLQGRESRKFLDQRQQLEANTANKSAGDPANTVQPAQRKFPRSPFVATSADQLDVNSAPPKRHEVLKPEVQDQPQPKTLGGQTVTRQDNSQTKADAAQPQNPQARVDVDSKEESGGRGAKRHKSESDANDQPRDRGGRRGNSQGASSDKSQDAPNSQPKRDSKKKGND